MKNPQKRRKKWCVGPEKVVRKPWAPEPDNRKPEPAVKRAERPNGVYIFGVVVNRSRRLVGQAGDVEVVSYSINCGDVIHSAA